MKLSAEELSIYLNDCPKEFIIIINKDVFNYIDGNRPIDMRRINNISEAIARGEDISPITVDCSTGLIVDGQHRYEAFLRCLKKGLEVSLRVRIISTDNPLLFAISMNSKTKRWSSSNYLHAYCTEKRESYLILDQFLVDHPLLSIQAAVELITGIWDSSKFSCGDLLITNDMLPAAEKRYQELLKLSRRGKIGNIVLTRTVIKSWVEIREKLYLFSGFDFDNYVEKVAKYFVTPTTDKLDDWKNAYMNVFVK